MINLRGIKNVRRAWRLCNRPDPFEGEIGYEDNAIIVPPKIIDKLAQPRTIVSDGGVFRSDGSICTNALPIGQGLIQFGDHQLSPDSLQFLTGTSIFAGNLYRHFGQFLLHSLGRLWAVEAAGPVDRIVFTKAFDIRSIFKATPPIVPLDPNDLPFAKELIGLIAGDVPVTIVENASRFERLVIPRSLTASDILSGHPFFPRHS